MADSPGLRLRLTVLGCTTAAPHEAAPAAGYLVQWADTNLLLDVGQGVIRNLQGFLDPHDLTGVVVGHMHADHYLDLVGLRYLYPWGEPAPEPLPVHLPPGGRARLDALADAISERDGFFDAAFDAVEYDPADELGCRRPALRFVRPATTCRPGAWSSRRPTALDWPTPATPAHRLGRSTQSAGRICSSSRAALRARPRTTTSNAAI